MGYYLKLASRAAFRPGKAKYCGHINEVHAGSWVGGIVGLKSVLGIKDRKKVLEIMNQLEKLGYITYSLDSKTKKLTYTITDWVMKCAGTKCSTGAIYATEGYGFLCIPKDITMRLVEQKYVFAEMDAWLDLWCHTTWGDQFNAFSRLAPVVQIEKGEAALTLESLGQRWGWERPRFGNL